MPQTRKAHAALVSLTVFSWIGLGFFYGFGYCFITDWQWDVKRRLGETDLPSSFIKYLVDKTFFVNSDPGTIDMITGLVFLGVVIITLYVNLRKRRRSY